MTAVQPHARLDLAERSSLVCADFYFVIFPAPAFGNTGQHGCGATKLFR
jgi:hypothetical protein